MTNQLIKDFEGFRSDPYRCAAGIATIGYGTTRYENGSPVTIQDSPITERYAEQLLEHHLNANVRPIMKLVIKTPLNLNQKQAIESLIYNIGATAFRRSTMLERLNLSDYEGSAAEFMSWIYVNRSLNKGLIKRRTDELLLFLRPAYKAHEEPKQNKENDSVWASLLSKLTGG